MEQKREDLGKIDQIKENLRNSQCNEVRLENKLSLLEKEYELFEI